MTGDDSRGSLKDTAVISPVPIQGAEVGRIQATYGVTTAWFGASTHHWWALDRDHLVEGATPDRLGEAILAARRAGARRWAR